jgi:NADH-quinone oxidoreductase subunit E
LLFSFVKEIPCEEERPMSVTFKSLENILERYPPSPEHLISALQDVQAKFNYLPAAAMTAVCDHLGVPISRGWAVATFYKAFSLKPRGEHGIRVCQGTACHLKGAKRLVENLSRELQVQPGDTTEDMKFTLETVNCLGACALAPVAVVDDTYYARVTAQKLDKALKKISAE